MDWSIVALLNLLTLTLVVTSHHLPDDKLLSPKQNHIPPSNVLTFQRSSVEGIPKRFDFIHDDYDNDEDEYEFGSVSLPLREAVEASPHVINNQFEALHDDTGINLDLGRTPLRDAVEQRPPPPLGDNIFNHDSIWFEQLTSPAIRRSQGPVKILCHFDAAAVHRTEPFSLYPDGIPSRMCSHIIYNAVTLDIKTLLVIPIDSGNDKANDDYKNIVDLRKKNPSLRVLISMNLPKDEKFYKELLDDNDGYERLSRSIEEFVERNDFDGVEINWENVPIHQLKLILKPLHRSLTVRDKILAVTLKPHDYADPELAEVSDILLLQSWKNIDQKYTTSPAPLRLTLNFMKRWLNSGVNPNKLILDVPLFGNSYTLKTRNQSQSRWPVDGPGISGLYTKIPGKLAYYEICEKIENLWDYNRDRDGAFLQRGDQWIGYDDPLSIKIKIAYIKSMGLSGISLSTLDFDDFIGICGESWPILTVANNAFGISNTPIDKCDRDGIFSDPKNCNGFLICDKSKLYRGICDTGYFFDSIKIRCVKSHSGICNNETFEKFSDASMNYSSVFYEKQHHQKLHLRQSSPRVICYMTSWALYRKGDGKFVPEHLDTQLCTDVIYAFAGLNPDTLTLQPFDSWADIDNGLYQRITSMKGTRVLLAIGGWTDSAGDKYSRLVNSPSARKKFITTTINFLHTNNFDGISIEWNYPKCWQSNCKKGLDSDRPSFTKFIRELREAFDNESPHLILAVSLSGYREVIDRAYDVRELSNAADFLSVMTYDYHGAWESKTGHLAPLYSSPNDPNPFYSMNWTMNYLASLGADRMKLLAGIPFYGQAYRLTQPDHSRLGDAAAGPGNPGEFTGQPGMLAYYEICERIKRQEWKSGDGPSAHFKNQFVGYDDINSIAIKAKWILQNGFGGATAWTVDLDDFHNKCCYESFPLLRSLNRALGRLLDPAPVGENCERPSEPVTPQAPIMTTHSDANEGGPRPTHPMTSTSVSTTTTAKTTTWPTWTENTSKYPMTIATSWPTWSWTSPPTSSTTTTIRAPTKWTTTTKRPITDDGKPDSSPAPGMPCNFGDYVADPMNCGKYFRCVFGELKRQSCTPGLHWDGTRHFCDWPAKVKCQQTQVTQTTQKPLWSSTQKPITTITQWWNETATRPTKSTTTTTTTTTMKPTTIRPVNTPKECISGQYYPHPESCSNFLICVNGAYVVQQCGPGLKWNKEKNMCDWAFNNPCKDKPKKNSPLMMKEMEPCTPGTFTRVQGDCESYHACLWDRRVKFPCAPGLHFNEQTNVCDWPHRAKCNEQFEATQSPIIGGVTSHRPTKPPMKPISFATTTTRKPTTTTQMPWTPSAKPLPPAIIDPDKISPLSGHFKVVCYFTNWAWYRRGVGKYLPEHIDQTLCTHIVYGFAVLDYSELTIKAHDSWADYDNRFYERVVAYKKRGLKVLLALGGWNDSAGDKYSRLVNSQSSRRKFIEHAIKFIEKYNFDGLDLDWEYPVCWQVDCKKGPDSDKVGFALLLKELSAEMKPRGLLMSAAVSPSKTVIDKGYDVPALAKYLDWIAVMAYDYHGQWDKKTGHVAPLYYHQDDEFYFFNANYSINYWISKGAPPRSIVMGMPLYGQAFSINDPHAGTGLNSPASAGTAGEFTKAAGFLSYYEICDRINNKNWQVVQDPQRRMGPYAFKGNQWVSFDDADMIRQKAQYIRDMGLAGGMVWALDLDDFKGRCGEGQHPLMHTLQLVLADRPNKHDKPIHHPTSGGVLQWQMPSKPPKTMRPLEHNPDEVVNINDEFKVVCYFTNWAWYRQSGGRFVPEDIDSDLCTHIIYGFAVLDGSTLKIKPHDSWADIDNKFYERVVKYKAKGIKVLIAIGGWNDSEGDKYSRLVNSPSSRSSFITHVTQFIEKYEFDGLDLDWEYPVCWQVDCKRGPASDKTGFSMLVKELSEAFKPKGLLLSSAVSPSKRVIDAGYDVPILSQYLDWISVMTYDFHGQWDKKTGHVAPLYVRPDDWEQQFNANFSIHYWLQLGAPAKKLIMGVPLYGQSFSLADRNAAGLNEPTYGGGEAGEATRARGFLAYYEICERTLRNQWKVVQDPERRIGPYASKGDQWVSFDDAQQVKLKAEFIKSLGLGGGMVWALDLDDFKNRCGCEPSPLLRTLNRVLRNYPAGPTCRVTGLNTAEAISTTIKPIYQPTESIDQQTTSETFPPIITTPEPDDSIEVIAGPPPPTPLPIGECEGRQFVPHKEDCSKYLICNFGQISELSCPSGLHWNQDRCDWPENAKCDIKSGSVEVNSNFISEWSEFLPHSGLSADLIIGKKFEYPSSNLLKEKLTNIKNKKVICYFTNWAWYRTGYGKYLPENIDSNLCTHIIYGFVVLDPVKLTIKMHDSWADIDNNFYTRVTAFKSKGVKVLVALGGWNDSSGDKYSRLVNNRTARNLFVKSTLKFVQKYGFDGLDFDWEYPVCWHVHCDRGPSSDKKSFAQLIKELSDEFKPHNLLLSAAVSPSKRVIDAGYDVPVLAKYLDWIAVMTYDFHGHWEKKTGHVAPLYYYPGDEYDYFNANFSIRYWIDKGASPSKLVMGVPLYGQSFTLANSTVNNLQSTAYGPGHAGKFTRLPGFLSFYEICENVKNGGWNVTKDPKKRIGPYVRKDNQWASYDDVSNVLLKAALIRELNLAGGMVWALDLDDFNNKCGCGKYPLLTALNRGLKGEIYGKDCT